MSPQKTARKMLNLSKSEKMNPSNAFFSLENLTGPKIICDICSFDMSLNHAPAARM